MATVFTKIIHKEIPAEIVYEDDRFIAFLDIIQTTKGHVLVATKEEYVNVLSLPEELAGDFFKVVTKVAKAVSKAFGTDSVNVLSNAGKLASQQVFHCHVHVIPRYEKDGLNFTLNNHIHETQEEEYKERTKAIKEALKEV
jgi:histidine triad (HIT) family protein